MRTETFTTPDPVRLSVSNGAGEVVIDATDTTESTVTLEPGRDRRRDEQAVAETQVTLSSDGRALEIKVPHQWIRTATVRIRITVPTGSAVHVDTASADVRVTGRIAELEARTASADVTVEEIDGPARLSSASGDIGLGSVGGDVTSKTASGDLRIRRATGAVTANSASGDLRVDESAGDITAKVTSGTVTLGAVQQGRTEVRAVSGDVRIGIGTGAVAHLDVSTVSGHLRSRLPVDDEQPAGDSTVDVVAHTVSGDVYITSGAAV